MMTLKDIKLGYDLRNTGSGIQAGYLNIEATVKKEEGKFCYLWISRSYEYETVIMTEKSVFSVVMHMMRADADFDMEYDWIMSNAIEQYEYETGENPEKRIRDSEYYIVIQLCREVLNQYADDKKDSTKELVEQVYKKMNIKKEVLHNQMGTVYNNSENNL